MPSPRLRNYLFTHRKRSGLSQDEVAHLLGARGGAKISRYENFERDPSLRAALAFEAVFQKPLRELFAGLYEEIEQEIAERAKVISYKVSRQEGSGQNTQKLEALESIIKQLSNRS